MDFCYTRETATLSMRLRFSNQASNHPDIRPFVKYCNFASENDEGFTDDALVSKGDLLVDRSQNKVLKVISVEGQYVFVRQLGGDNDGVESILPLDTANTLALSGIVA